MESRVELTSRTAAVNVQVEVYERTASKDVTVTK